MVISTQDIELNDPLRTIGFDSIAAFGESASHLTDFANSENLGLVSKLNDEEDEEDDEDEDDEEDEDEDEDLDDEEEDED